MELVGRRTRRELVGRRTKACRTRGQKKRGTRGQNQKGTRWHENQRLWNSWAGEEGNSWAEPETVELVGRRTRNWNLRAREPKTGEPERNSLAGEPEPEELMGRRNRRELVGRRTKDCGTRGQENQKETPG